MASLKRVLLLFWLGGAATSLAQEKREMTIVDLIDVPRLQDAQLSPDGSQLVYLLAETDWKQNKRISHIWRAAATGGESFQLTNGKRGERHPRWSPDGRSIAFLATRSEEGNGKLDPDDKAQIFLLSNDGGEAIALTRHDPSVATFEWAPDGKSIYFLAPDPKTEEEKRKAKLKDDVRVFDEDYKHRHLWRVAVDGKESTRITKGDFSIRGFRLSPDGSQIAHHRAPTPLYDDSDEAEVWLMASDGSRARRLTTNTVAENSAELSHDGRWVLFLSSSNSEFDTYYNSNLFVVPASGGEHRLLLEEMPHEVESAHWAKNGKSIYFTANTGLRSQLFRVDVANESLTQLTRGSHSLSGWRYNPDLERHTFSINQSTNAGDVYSLPADGGVEPSRLTRVYEYLARDFRLPRQEPIRWKGEDGADVEGLLFYPLDYREGTRYPLVVQTHGGPASSDQFGFGRWSSYVQVLTARGYFVFKPNYRGSTGYGDAVLRDMVGHYFRQAHLDVMTGVDHLIAEGLVDGRRMAKMGWSGGGHMTNKIITHTDRFRAASSGAGAVNWISMYAQSDVRIYRTPWFGGTPWQSNAPIGAYWEHSPLKDISKVTTPTIVLVGERDVRVPPPQSVELYRALRSNGVDTHLYIAPREPHGWRELRHELFKVNVELEWFERYVRGIDYEWEAAPGGSEETEPAVSTDKE